MLLSTLYFIGGLITGAVLVLAFQTPPPDEHTKRRVGL